jgi:hypothetical protein
MGPEGQVVEGKTPTVGENPTGDAAGLGVTPADATDTRASLIQPEVSREVTTSDLQHIVKEIREIRETAERMSELAKEMCDLAERVYQKLREVQRFIAEERRLANERCWILMDKRIQRSFECAVTIVYAMVEVEGIMKRLAPEVAQRQEGEGEGR